MAPTNWLLVATLSRYWLTIFPLARRALGRWRDEAAAIPDHELRRLAERTLNDEHMNAEGAAIFATVAPWRLTRPLVRACVAYQVLYDYLDTITELEHARPADTRQLHRALLDALDPSSELSDWYALHPRRDDGGYVATLVQVCRDALQELPAYDKVAPSALRFAELSRQVQALNHASRMSRASRLARWSRGHTAGTTLLWWECAAAASSSLGVHVLLALAADTTMTQQQAEAAALSYCVSLCALNTLLESLVDLPHDALTGDHSLAGYYRTPHEAAERLGTIARETRCAADSLPRGDRHTVILAGMVGFYLSTAEAWEPHAREASSRTLAAIGGPTKILMRMLRLRRAL